MGLTLDKKSISQWTYDGANQLKLKTWFQSTTTSTNDVAKELPGYDLYLTDHQTSGRGRNQNTWLTPEQQGVLLSTWCFNLNQSPQHIAGPIWGLALYASLKDIWPKLKFSLKPPNDIYLEDKKLAGLLIEASSQEKNYQLFIGLGLNVLHSPKELPFTTNLAAHLNADEYLTIQEWQRFIKSLYSHFQKAKTDCCLPELTPKHCLGLKEAINNHPSFEGQITKIDGQGNLYLLDKITSWISL